jgi:D-alanyl-lipoteichoic acid acyltransferase DltB (MBOAT superfamily)
MIGGVPRHGDPRESLELVFTSFDYALLLAATLCAYWLLPARASRLVLAVASLVFYAFWSVPFLALVGASIGTGYAAARFIDTARREGRERSARMGVAATTVVLIGTLAAFKYGGGLLGWWAERTGATSPALQVVLPLAISFYTFQILAYVIDVNRGGAIERSLLRFSVFVGFFPQLIAGPICRAHELLPQLHLRPRFDPRNVLLGLELLAYGLVKKTVFADNLAVIVDRVYGDPASAGGFDIAIATAAFSVQLYCDFSGYTDIARGSARMLGIELPVNFRSPFVARSITELWGSRWHVTLSSWLRDYLYIPLGGNRRGFPRVCANLFATMVLGGLWHGGTWTFALWGAWHGVFLVAERIWSRMRSASSSSAGQRFNPLGVLYSVLVLNLGFGIFRAGDFETLRALGARVTADPLGVSPLAGSVEYLPLIALFYALHWTVAWLREQPFSATWPGRVAIAAPALAFATVVVVVFGGSSDAFVYFQF